MNAGPVAGPPPADDAGTRLRIAVEPAGADPGHRGRVTIALDGEVDPHTAPRLQQLVDDVVAGGADAVRIDCRHLRFIDSSGLRVLVHAHRRLGADRPGALVLGRASPTLRRLLEVTGLDGELTVEPDTR